MIYDVNGTAISTGYDLQGNSVSPLYDIDGNPLVDEPYISGVAYPFCEMSYLDEHNVCEQSDVRVRNGNTSIKYHPTVKGNAITPDSDYEYVVFTCNIPTNGKHAGIWIHFDPIDSSVYGGLSSTNRGIGRFKIKLNNSTYIWESYNTGTNYYRIPNPPSVITSVSIAALQNSNSQDISACMYLDSVEVGFSMKKAYVMFNLDCVPSHFIDVGYPLFERYGFKCTLHYPISSSDSTAGADSDYFDPVVHNQLMNNGYDYATYSGWQRYEYDESVPFYDSTANRARFEAHAERMWKVNNDSHVFAPSCVHGTGFQWGSEYQRACREYEFLMIRKATGGMPLEYYDPDQRTMIPYFIENVWTSTDSKVTALKDKITSVANAKQALQIGFHRIMSSDYDYEHTSGSGIYVNEVAIGEILSHVKSLVDSGDLVCCTTAEFVRQISPETYNSWLQYRESQTQ